MSAKKRGAAEPNKADNTDVRSGLEQILAEAKEFREREQMTDQDIHKEAREAALAAVSARLHLWQRLTLRHQHN